MPAAALWTAAEMPPKDEKFIPIGMPDPSGRGEPHLGQDGLLLKTKLLLFTHAVFGHCQSPGDGALLGVPQEGQEAFLRKTILVWFTQATFGQAQSPGSACPGIPGIPPPKSGMAPKPDNSPGMLKADAAAAAAETVAA